MGFEEYGHQVHDWLSQLYTSRGVHPDETIRVCNQILEYARKLDDEKLLGLAYYYLGETYYLLNNVDRLFLNVSSSLVYLENTGQYELIARAYNILTTPVAFNFLPPLFVFTIFLLFVLECFLFIILTIYFHVS